MKVMIVDDSIAMHRVEKNHLARMGIADIVEAFNGREGLATLKAEMPVDLILLDINMPEMDGMALLKEIRANPEFNGVRVVMVTSEGEKEKVIEALRSGADDYVVKPFSPDEFKERIAPV